RNVGNSRDLRQLNLGPMVHETRDAKRLPVFQFDLSFCPAGGYRRNAESRNCQPVGKVQGTDFGGDVQPNHIVVAYCAGKVQAHAEGLELNGDAGKSLAGLNNGKGKLTSSEEGCFLTVHRHQVGLGQNFKNGLLLQVLDGRAQVDVRPEQEDVQQVTELQRGSCPSVPCADHALDAGSPDGRAGELLRAHGPDGIGCSQAEKVEAELLQLGAVNLGEFNFQQNLAFVQRLHLQRADHLIGIHRRHLVQVFGSLAVGNIAG